METNVCLRCEPLFVYNSVFSSGSCAYVYAQPFPRPHRNSTSLLDYIALKFYNFYEINKLHLRINTKSVLSVWTALRAMNTDKMCSFLKAHIFHINLKQEAIEVRLIISKCSFITKYVHFYNFFLIFACFQGQHLNLLEYHVPRSQGCLAELFRVLENHKAFLQIKHYSISQTTLEQVFYHFYFFSSRHPFFPRPHAFFFLNVLCIVVIDVVTG